MWVSYRSTFFSGDSPVLVVSILVLMLLLLVYVTVQCVLTASADATIKLWAIGDYSCIKTFEGHTNSVLKALFISRGMQIASR